MLDYLGEKKSSQAIFDATEKVLSEGKSFTYDMGRSAKVSQMVDVKLRRWGRFVNLLDVGVRQIVYFLTI